ncbi:uncharacterized protein [Apostichopus japonicus]|uniref:uncharacterized protein isoform X3 n=1 Tax=Stichopus japonicus TaxID=307972 RepID=UPI003AB772E4
MYKVNHVSMLCLRKLNHQRKKKDFQQEKLNHQRKKKDFQQEKQKIIQKMYKVNHVSMLCLRKLNHQRKKKDFQQEKQKIIQKMYKVNHVSMLCLRKLNHQRKKKDFQQEKQKIIQKMSKPSEEEERFSTREAKDHSKYVQSESCVYALPTKAKPSEEEETFSTREAKDHSKNMQSESCVCALTTKAKTSEEEETFSAREDKTDTIVRDEDDVGDVLINSYFGENKHQAPYDRKINTPYGRRNYGENQYQASTSYERKIKTPYFIKESHQEEEYSAIDDEMFDFKTIKDNQIRFITRLSKGHISDRWLVAFSAKLGTMKYVFICQAAKSKTDNQQHEWDVFAKEYNKIPASPHILKCLGSCYLNDQVYIVQTYTKMETLQDHVTLSAYELQKRLTDDMVALVKELLQFSLQTASGMAFILSQGFSHPSLSIANILLTDNKNCKLFDFCLRKDALCFLESIKTKSVDTSLYERSEFQGLVEYTTATDVWLTAYAIWQIFSQGALPIASGSDHDDVSDVFPKPELCPQILYIEMTRCWSEPRSNRPDIEELSSQLTKHAIGPHKTDDGLKQ